MFSWVTDAIGVVGNIVGEPLKEWQKRKTIKVEQAYELSKLAHQVKINQAQAAVEMAKNGQQNDYDLDRIAMKNMDKSWKDELVLIVFLVPMMMAFFPKTADYALAGFAIIAKMPEWYVAIIIGMVVVIYGLRGLLKTYLQRSTPLSLQNKQGKPSTPRDNVIRPQ
jgi:cation transport ATPase